MAWLLALFFAASAHAQVREAYFEREGMWSDTFAAPIVDASGREVGQLAQWYESVTDCATTLTIRRARSIDLDGDGDRELCVETIEEAGAGLFEVLALEERSQRWYPSTRTRRVEAFSIGEAMTRLPGADATCPSDRYTFLEAFQPRTGAIAWRLGARHRASHLALGARLMSSSSSTCGTVTAPSCGAGTVPVPAGRHWVGAPYGECPDETRIPSQSVAVRAQCVDESAVATSDYEVCVAAGACPSIDPTSAPYRNAIGWDDARAYCRFRGGHLPTEAQLDRAFEQTGVQRGPDREWTSTHANESRPWLAPVALDARPRDRIALSSIGREIVDALEGQEDLGFRCVYAPSGD